MMKTKFILPTLSLTLACIFATPRTASAQSPTQEAAFAGTWGFDPTIANTDKEILNQNNKLKAYETH